MESKRFELTLSRWHKVAERLSALAAERVKLAKDLYTNTQVSSWNKAGVTERAARLAEEAKAALGLHSLLVDAIVAIRSRLALRNAELGVSAKLSELAGLERRIGMLNAILQGQFPDMVRPVDLGEVPRELAEDRGFLKSATRITLRLLPDAEYEAMRAEHSALQGRAHALADAVADLNRSRMELELHVSIARLAGLPA